MSQIVLNDDHLLFGSGKSPVDISTFHPEPIHIFKLWQLYLDNVNPLLKVTHTPSMQVRIIEAASNVSAIEPPLEALMFSIYCMAVLSLTHDDCLVTLGSTKEDLMIRYQFGCQQALLNCGFLRTTDRECLTALFLYLVSFLSVVDVHPLIYAGLGQAWHYNTISLFHARYCYSHRAENGA